MVGLGNPGREYAASRHNIGFAVLERLAARWCIALVPEPGRLVGRGLVCGVRTVLVKPQTFMNRSGEAVATLAEIQDGADLLVVHDDLDLPAACLKIRHDGGAGGHRGVLSIIEHVGTNFDRLKVGVGRPPRGRSAADYVLEPMTEAELSGWGDVIERASDALECWLAHGVDQAMTRYNARREG